MSSPKEDIKEVNKKVEDSEEKQETEQEDKDQGEWTPVWDSNAQAYYYWNTKSNETTWENPLESKDAKKEEENPLDFLLDRIDNDVKKKLDKKEKQKEQSPQEQQQQNYSQEYYDYYNQYYYNPTSTYSSQAHFNSRTGRFTAQADAERLNPEYLSYEARATRQMQGYFDVEAYMEQRNLDKALEGRIKKKPLTRKEIKYFKKMKQEKKLKKAKEWLLD